MTATAALPIEEQAARLNRQAERKAESMVVGEPTDGCQPIDLTHMVLRIHRDEHGRAVQFDLWSRETHGAADPTGCYFTSRDGCTCIHWQMRVQHVPGAACGHQVSSFGPPDAWWHFYQPERAADEVEAAAARMAAQVRKMFG